MSRTGAPCSICADTGTVPVGRGGPDVREEPCECRRCGACEGSGRVDHDGDHPRGVRCDVCGGSGVVGIPKEARGASTTSGDGGATGAPSSSSLGDAFRQQLTVIGLSADLLDEDGDIRAAVSACADLSRQVDRDAAQHEGTREALAGALARLRETEGRLAATEQAGERRIVAWLIAENERLDGLWSVNDARRRTRAATGRPKPPQGDPNAQDPTARP